MPILTQGYVWGTGGVAETAHKMQTERQEVSVYVGFSAEAERRPRSVRKPSIKA